MLFNFSIFSLFLKFCLIKIIINCLKNIFIQIITTYSFQI